MGEGVKKEYRVSLTYNGVHPNPDALINHALEKQFLIYEGSVSVSEMPETQGWTQDRPTEDGWYFYSSEKNPCVALRHEKGRFWVQIPRGYDHPVIFKPKDGLWCRIPDPPPRGGTERNG